MIKNHDLIASFFFGKLPCTALQSVAVEFFSEGKFYMKEFSALSFAKGPREVDPSEKFLRTFHGF